MVTTVAFVGVIIVFLGLALTAYAVYLTEGRDKSASRVLDANVRDRHLDDVEPGAIGDTCHPFVASNCREPLGHGLVLRGRRNFDSVRDAVHVLDRDAA